MSYHEGPTSPPSYEIDSISPVSQRTPKRRRVGSGDSIDFEPFRHSPSRYSPPMDPFDTGAFSPIQDGDMPPSLQINNNADPFSLSSWDNDMFWEPLPPLNTVPQTPTNQIQSQPQPQNQHLNPNPNMNPNQAIPQPVPQSTNPPPNYQPHSQFGTNLQSLQAMQQQMMQQQMRQNMQQQIQQNLQPVGHQPDQFWHMPPVPHPISYRPMPPAPHRLAQELPPNMAPLSMPGHGDPSMWASPQYPAFRHPMYTTTNRVQYQPASRPRPAPAPPAPRKGGISLTLSRANPTSIESLPEHKRECPACQLEFEPDDYLAVISCCGTATHAACMSAWVNSAAYAKTKVCMKCRKLIDARKPLNQIVPPVTDKSWDRGLTFAAPDDVQADKTTEFDITGRSESATRRQYRREMALLHRQRGAASVAIVPETDVPARSRGAYRQLLQEQRQGMEELEARYHAARALWRSAFENEASSASAVSIAKERYQIQTGGGQPVHPDINALSEAVKAARKEQEQRHSEFRAVSKEYDEVKKRHSAEQIAFLQRVSLQMAASESHETSSTSSD